MRHARLERLVPVAAAALVLGLGPVGPAPGAAAQKAAPAPERLAAGTAPGDEVWATEQNGNGNGGANSGAGSVVVFRASDMSTKTVIETDGTDPRTCLAGQAPPACTRFVRPHTVLFTNDYRYAFVVATVSGNIGVFDTATKQLLQSFAVSPGTAPHAIFPTYDDTRAFAVGIGGAKPFVREYVRDFSNPARPFVEGRFLGLDSPPAVAALAPDPAVAAKVNSPTAVPKPMRAVCPGFSGDSKNLYVTLSLGGVLVFDITTPRNDFFVLTTVFDANLLPRNGCGLILSRDGDRLYLDAGDIDSSDILVVDVGPGPGGRPRNQVLATIHASGDGVTSPPGQCQERAGASCDDLHSLHFADRDKELWLYSRTDDSVAVLKTTCQGGNGAGCHKVKEVLRFGPRFDSPDLSIVNRGGNLAYVTQRGPDPAPTAAHPISGNHPGVAVIDLEARSLLTVVPLRQTSPCPFTPGPPSECDDPHGVAYRYDPPPTTQVLSRKTGGM